MLCQGILKALLERLAIDHPHHTISQLLALSHGDLGKNGKPGHVDAAVQHRVDFDKVSAAKTLLERIAQNPERSGCLFLSCHSRTSNTAGCFETCVMQ